MDKARELRRGGSRSSPAKQRQPKASALNGYNVVFSEKSRKERVRSVRVSWRASPGRDDSEMGGEVSGGEEEHRMPSTGNDRRYKLNGKASDDCGHADPPSVPRKLRSAMSKRSRESLSPPVPDAKRHHHILNEAELPSVNGMKRSKHNTKQGSFVRSSKQPISITKEEEEVAEVLYCLATIFPDNKPDECDGESLVVKEEALPLVETAETSLPLSEVSKEGSTKTACVSTETDGLANPSSCQDDLPKVPAEAEPMTKSSIPDQSTSSGSHSFDLELNSPAQTDIQGINSSTDNESAEKMRLCGSVNASLPNQILSESAVGNGSLQTVQPEIFSMREAEETGTLQAVPVALKWEVQPITEDSKTGAQFASVEGKQQGIPTGLSDSLGNLTRSSQLQAAACLESTCTTASISASNDVLPMKLPPVPVKLTRSLKRCATHMHICRLIHLYQSKEQKSRCSLSENHLKSKEGARLGVIGAANSTAIKNVSNHILPAGANSLVAQRNLSNEVMMLQDSRSLQDLHASTATMVYSNKQQSCDFLSLSSSPESNNMRNGLELSAQLQAPYMHPLVQHPVIPFSLPNDRFSSPYPDQLAVAAATQQVQLLPQYMSNPYYGVQAGHGGGSSNQQQQQQQQQQHQQQLWAAAHMAQYRHTGFPSQTPPKWQNSRHDSCSLPQSAIPPSSSSVELLGAKYSHNPQQLFALPFSSSSRLKKQLPQIRPSGYEDGASAAFRSDGTTPRQLLCNVQRI